MEPDVDNFTYITDRNNSLSHVRLIDPNGNGDVHEMRDVDSGGLFARKLVFLPHSQRQSGLFQNEAHVVRKLSDTRHENVIHILRFGVFRYSPYSYIDMELCDFNLYYYMYSKRNSSESQTNFPPTLRSLSPSSRSIPIWNIVRQIASALEFIHINNEIHRDLKPSNVLYSRSSSTWKVSDFGIASKATASRLWDPTNTRPIEGCYAPEIASSQSFTNKVDIWSMGCIFYELVVGKSAFRDDIAVFKHYFRNQTVDVNLDNEFEESDKDKITTILRSMLHKEPSERPSASTLFKEFSKRLEVKNGQGHPDNERRDPDCLNKSKVQKDQGKVPTSQHTKEIDTSEMTLGKNGTRQSPPESPEEASTTEISKPTNEPKCKPSQNGENLARNSFGDNPGKQISQPHDGLGSNRGTRKLTKQNKKGLIKTSEVGPNAEAAQKRMPRISVPRIFRRKGPRSKVHNQDTLTNTSCLPISHKRRQ